MCAFCVFDSRGVVWQSGRSRDFSAKQNFSLNSKEKERKKSICFATFLDNLADAVTDSKVSPIDVFVGIAFVRAIRRRLLMTPIVECFGVAEAFLRSLHVI